MISVVLICWIIKIQNNTQNYTLTFLEAIKHFKFNQTAVGTYRWVQFMISQIRIILVLSRWPPRYILEEKRILLWRVSNLKSKVGKQVNRCV